MASVAIYNGIVADFEGAWLGLSRVDFGEAGGRGNFLFSRQAMVLLEYVCRLASPDRAVSMQHTAFCEALHALEPRYFGLLPGPCASDEREFVLPCHGPSPERQLIRGLFDLMRNGGAHQYQQIPVVLTDDRAFGISIPNGSMPDVRRLGDPRRRVEHLAYQKQDDATWLMVCPDTLFLDIKEAAEAAGIPEAAATGALTFRYLKRGKQKPKYPTWLFREDDLLSTFRVMGLRSVDEVVQAVRERHGGPRGSHRPSQP